MLREIRFDAPIQTLSFSEQHKTGRHPKCKKIVYIATHSSARGTDARGRPPPGRRKRTAARCPKMARRGMHPLMVGWRRWHNTPALCFGLVFFIGTHPSKENSFGCLRGLSPRLLVAVCVGLSVAYVLQYDVQSRARYPSRAAGGSTSSSSQAWSKLMLSANELLWYGRAACLQ